MPSVVCVLGCRVGSQALARRAQAGRDVFFARNAALIVACGGRKWAGRVEADVIAALLVEKGVPKDAIVRERCSLDTRDNACFAASMLERRSFRDVIRVSCSWHLPRAARLFERAGLEVVERIGADPPLPPPLLSRVYHWGRERVCQLKDERRAMDIARRSS